MLMNEGSACFEYSKYILRSYLLQVKYSRPCEEVRRSNPLLTELNYIVGIASYLAMTALLSFTSLMSGV